LVDFCTTIIGEIKTINNSPPPVCIFPEMMVVCIIVLLPLIGGSIKQGFYLTSVCLWHTSGLSQKQRPRKTKIGTEAAHITRDSDTTFKVTRPLYSPLCWRIRQLQCWAGNVLAVRNCCYVAICSATTHFGGHGGGEGRSISWRPPAYSLLQCAGAKTYKFYAVGNVYNVLHFCY